jgi:site-specific DNA recombinase
MDKNGAPKRGAYYIRESTEEQGKGYAPQAQKYSINEFAGRENISLLNTNCHYNELVSGRLAENRPEFQRMMEDAAAGRFDILLVYHTSRFARNAKEARFYKEQLRKQYGIDVVSVTQNFGDWNDPNAFFSESINEVIDEKVSRDISFYVRNTLAMKRRLGTQLGNPPFGYFKKQLDYDADKQRPIYESKWQIHQIHGPAVLELFKRYVTGCYSFGDLAQYLNECGLKTQLGNPFTYSSVKDILNNKSYCAVTYSPRKNLPEIVAKHPQLVPVDLFEEVQIMIRQRNKAHGRPTAQHRFYLLQGVVYCYKCRHHLHNKDTGSKNQKMLPRMYCETVRSNDKEYGIYGCKMRREYRNCDQRDIRCKVIDEQVENFMRGFYLPQDVIELILSKLDTRIISLPKSPTVLNKIKKLEEKLKRISRAYTDGNTTEETYLKDTQNVKNELAALGADTSIVEPQIQAKEFITRAERLLRDFPAMWDNETPEAKRQWILLTIKRVWVENDRVEAIEPHDKFKKLFPQLQEVLGQAPLATP